MSNENVQDVNTLKAQARAAAEKRLRDNNREEFAQYMTEEHASRGVEWAPRLTDAEKAQRRIIEDAKRYGLDLQSLADQVVTDAAFADAPVVDAGDLDAQRRAENAEAFFGAQQPLTER